MLTFITDIKSESEPDILTVNQHKPLLIVSLEGQYLARFNPPNSGWTHQELLLLARSFPDVWDFCGADALLGEQFVGSTEV